VPDEVQRELEPVGLSAPKSWAEEATNFASVEVTQTIDGSPMMAERYLAEKKESADSRAV
jgi:hypothetical protein